MEQELRARLGELSDDARKISEHARQALEHLDRGELKAVSQVIAVMHHKISAVSSDREGVLKLLEEHGVRPGD
ncbi:hypothetical protein SAMN05421833_108217 [Microbispora rosea]|uniref:Uncharacterized protein n=1 Tax=Microbispora rosea TaxID=58117 RepID=A0A1N7AIS1_9ACTN|nr:hypothetical protein [Microbispora rosea]SIR38992.1 hypothetical protein SAMN05421833_108217 [Microbispora rosea]